MDAWFPRINARGAIASGARSLWVDGVLFAAQGGNPAWAGLALVYNDLDGGTVIGTTRLPVGYNVLVGSDDGRWAGFSAPGAGRVDLYSPAGGAGNLPGACVPRFGDGKFGYLFPYQTRPDNMRTLMVDGVAVVAGVLLDFVIGAGTILWQTATSTYGRALATPAGPCNIRDDEAPIALFTAPDRTPWVVTQTQIGTMVRPVASPFGYFLAGDLYNPDARMIEDRLRVVGSSASGQPLFDHWIDFTAPRVDLRLVGVEEPPVTPPIIPPVIPPETPPDRPPVIPPVIPPTRPPATTRFHRKELHMQIDGKTVVLRGPGGKLGRPDAPNTGVWAGLGTGWRGVIWDGTDVHNPLYHHRATKVEDNNYALVHIENNGLAGVDATKYSTGLDKQFYYKPDGITDRGGYETFCVYSGNSNGALQGQIDYNDESGQYFSASVAIEVVG
jgi:hypothetical protein